MPQGLQRDPIAYLVRNVDVGALLSFCQRLSEGLAGACADSAKAVPAKPHQRPAVYARGALRRHYMDRAIRQAASEAGLPIRTGSTDPASWSYPLVQAGAFSITVGIVDRPRTRSAHRLRGRGQYMRDHAARNEPLNPQGSLLAAMHPDVTEVIPAGAFGGLIVVEPSMAVPDSPRHIGFWVPSPDLKQPYYRCSMEQLIATLRDLQAAAKKPARKVVQRKAPQLKRRPGQPPKG